MGGELIMKWRKAKGEYLCTDDCEICQGEGQVFDRLQGFINRHGEQETRDIYSPCPNAEWDGPDIDALIDQRRDARLMDMDI
jgi:hypothetical protein